jgi:predicted homoserine dehydrogenase-like protein
LAKERAAEGRPVAVGLIGAGKFGAMFLAQARHCDGLRVAAIADLRAAAARETLLRTGWPAEAADGVRITDDAGAVIASDDIEVVIEATGDPAAGIRHARACRAAGKHLVMVNVEADALAGPLLAREAERAGLVYSLAYGDQWSIRWPMATSRR